MLVISSSDLLNEFTLYADKAVDEKETLIVQRSSGKNLVVMSMEQYNEMQKKIFLAKEAANGEVKNG
ncbi:MAG TPA: type II toxin-antitoxin system Phd/YefM family antitoxin [Candidatus Megamonas gallistercoris]|nr:type II toxin-antitoxin system Phd/YefM family antitoxin [Candidatus Megamonas gallistercoris]